MALKREHIENALRGYVAACNEANSNKIMSYLQFGDMLIFKKCKKIKC